MRESGMKSEIQNIDRLIEYIEDKITKGQWA